MPVAVTVLLPEDLRLPDLSTVRRASADEVAAYGKKAYAAMQWGPDERNGCRRVKAGPGYVWLDSNGKWTSPDAWTPATGNPLSVEWHQHGTPHSADDQPSMILGVTLYWLQQGMRHRAHGPVRLTGGSGHEWAWHAHGESDRTLIRLLDRAWETTDLTDAAARSLLERAGKVPDDPFRFVRPQVWVAHVLAANPSEHLSSDTRAWLALLTA